MEEEVQLDDYCDTLGLMTPADMAFVHEVIGVDLISGRELSAMLNEPSMRREILDSPGILESINEKKAELEISEFFYYSTYVRQVMLSAGLENQDYTDNVAASLVRMAHMQRKELKREESTARYLPVNLQVIREEGPYGFHIRIYCKLEPFEMMLEGLQVNMSGYMNENGSPDFTPCESGTGPDSVL